MVKAREIMTTPVISVKKDTPMFEAAQILSTNNISGIPVVDDDMILIGMISEKDILDLFDTLQYAEDRTVNSSMSHEVVSFDVADDLVDICDCLKKSHFRRIPVTSKGKLEGVISRRDIILYMLRQRRKNMENAV
ncbi:MAG: CBS domain-containing protein [Planctomycetota bacterium]|jgi:CBS domain-containing protein